MEILAILVIFLCVLVAFLVFAVVHLARRAQNGTEIAQKLVLDLSERRFTASAGAELRAAHIRSFQPAQPLHSTDGPEPPMWQDEPEPPEPGA